MRLTLAHWWLMVAMPLRAAGSDSDGSPGSAARDERVVVQIVDHTQVHEYAAAYGSAPLRLVTSRRRTPTEDLRRAAEAEVLRGVNAAKRRLVGAAPGSPCPPSPPVKWSDPSSDGAYSLVGYESPLDVRRTAAVVWTSGDSELWRLKLRGYVEDSLWSPDSKTVVVLESTERWLKSPRGLLRIMVGHPVPLSTFFLMACNVESRTCDRIQIASDLEFATARLQRHSDEQQGSEP